MREVTAGTAVVATTVWRGLGTIEDQRETVFADEDIGYISKVDRTYNPKLLAALSMPDVEATFEQLPHILEAGIKVVGTGVADGTGSGKVYAYPFPTTAVNTLKTYTIEGGDNEGAEEMEYAFVSGFKLSGAAGEALMMSADWLGRQVSVATFTAGQAVPSVEEIFVSMGTVFIDAGGGTIGSTQASNTILEIALAANTGLKPVFTANGAKYFSFVKITEPEVMLDLTFEHDATSIAEKAAWRAQTTRLIRLKFIGTALTTAGTYTYKTLQIDLAGKWEKFDAIGDKDGNDIVKGSFRARYSSTDTLFASLTVVNQVTALP